MSSEQSTQRQTARPAHGGMGGHGMGRGGGEKSKDFVGSWKKLMGYCKKYLIPILIAVVCAAGGTVFTLVGPDQLSKLTRIITDGLFTGIDLDAVFRIGIFLAALYLAGAILSFTQHFIMSTIAQGVSKQMRSDISRKINRLPMSFYSRTSNGDILSRVTNDVDMISQSLNQSIGMMVSAITLFLGSLIMMLATNVILTLTAVAATLIGFVLLRLITGRSQKYFSRQQKHLGELDGHIEEIYAGHTVVKAYNGEAASKKAFDNYNQKLKDSAFKAQSLSGLMQPLMTFIGNFGYVAVCVVGAVLTMNGQCGFEVIVAFMMYVRYFTQPLSQIAQAIQSLQSGAAAGERVFEFLEGEEMEDESGKTACLDKAPGVCGI